MTYFKVISTHSAGVNEENLDLSIQLHGRIRIEYLLNTRLVRYAYTSFRGH
jgi:hypothetical protein